MKKYFFIATSLFISSITFGQQSMPLTAYEHNLIVQKVFENKKSLMTDQGLIKCKNENEILYYIATKPFIPDAIKLKVSFLQKNTFLLKPDTISKSDNLIVSELFKKITNSHSADSILAIVQSYKNKFKNTKLQEAILFSENILKNGLNDIYNPTYYIKNNILSGAPQSYAKQAAANIAGDDVKGAIGGAIGGALIPTGVSSAVCGAVGGVGASIGSAVWEMIDYFFPDQNETPLLPTMEGVQQNIVDCINNPQNCSGNPVGYKPLSVPEQIKQFYNSTSVKNTNVIILARRRFVSGGGSTCIPLFPQCLCFTDPCDCNEICIPKTDVLSMEKTLLKDSHGDYLSKYTIKRGATISAGKSGNMTIENFYKNKILM